MERVLLTLREMAKNGNDWGYDSYHGLWYMVRNEHEEGKNPIMGFNIDDLNDFLNHYEKNICMH